MEMFAFQLQHFLHGEFFTMRFFDRAFILINFTDLDPFDFCSPVHNSFNTLDMFSNTVAEAGIKIF